jgi:hypothetical protein
MVQKSKTMSQYICEGKDIARIGKQILDTVWPFEPIRLLGLKMDNLMTKEELDKMPPKISKYFTVADEETKEK